MEPKTNRVKKLLQNDESIQVRMATKFIKDSTQETKGKYNKRSLTEKILIAHYNIILDLF